jgi:hypothetical protein
MDSLNSQLRRPEPVIGDDGFSERVMHALPPRRFRDAKKARWTLGAAAAAGGVLTALLGPPLGNAFGSLASGGSYALLIATVLFVAIVAVPTVWALCSE